MQNEEIMVAYKHEKRLKELLTRADPCNFVNNVDDEIHTYFPCKQRCDSCANLCSQKVVWNDSLQIEFSKLEGLLRFQKCNLYCILFKLFQTRSLIYC